MQQSPRDLSTTLRVARRIRVYAFAASGSAIGLWLNGIKIVELSLVATFGQNLFLAVYAIGGFLSILGPMVIAAYILSRNHHLLICKHCRSSITGIFAIRRDGLCAKCRRCSTPIDIAPPSTQEIATDVCILILSVAVMFTFWR